MKKVLLVLTLVLGTLVSNGQETNQNYIKDNVFYTIFKSGAGEEIPVKFSFGDDFLNKITETEVYKLWETETFNNPANSGYIERNKDKTHIELYLMGSTYMASFYSKMGLKNTNSYTPINGEGFIYINDKGEVNFSFPFKGQNGYGNFIISKGYYTEFVKDGKKKNRNFIS